VGGMFVGLALQLLIIPLSATTHSPLNMAEPSNWSRFWDYVSLRQYGGNFLFDLSTRKSPFVSSQLADLLGVMRDNVFHPAPSSARTEPWLSRDGSRRSSLAAARFCADWRPRRLP